MNTETQPPYTLPHRPQWYTRAGAAVLTVPSAKDGEPRRATLRDARKLDLLPDSGVVLRVLAQPGTLEHRAQHMARLALSREATGLEDMDTALDEISEEAGQASSAALLFAATFREHVLCLAHGRLPAPVPGAPDVSPWVDVFRRTYLPRLMCIYWADELLLSSRSGYAARADLLIAHPYWGISLVDIRTQAWRGKAPALQPQWAYKLAACRMILGPGVTCCTLAANSEKPGELMEVWWSPHKMEDAKQAFKSALVLWRSLTGYDPRPRSGRKGGL